MAAILDFKMAATRGREYVGGIFFSAPLEWVYPCAKFHACFKNWTILVLCRSTTFLTNNKDKTSNATINRAARANGTDTSASLQWRQYLLRSCSWPYLITSNVNHNSKESNYVLEVDSDAKRSKTSSPIIGDRATQCTLKKVDSNALFFDCTPCPPKRKPSNVCFRRR